MVLGRPQHVVAETIHELRHAARSGEGLPQAFRGIAPVVGGRAGKADIVELDLADIEHMEVSDHRTMSPASKVSTAKTASRRASTKLAGAGNGSGNLCSESAPPVP